MLPVVLLTLIALPVNAKCFLDFLCLVRLHLEEIAPHSQVIFSLRVSLSLSLFCIYRSLKYSFWSSLFSSRYFCMCSLFSSRYFLPYSVPVRDGICEFKVAL